MSLIQEALKRQQEEAVGGQARKGGPKEDRGLRAKAAGAAAAESAPAPAVPAAPPPLPAAPAAPVQPPPEDAPPPVVEKRKRSPLVLVGAGAVVLLLGAVGLAAAWFYGRQKLMREGIAVPAPVETNAAASETPMVVASQAAPVAVAAPPKQAAVPAPTSQPVQAAVEPAASNAAAAPAEPPPEPEIRWPKLLLTSVVGKGARGFARINGQLVGVGESIENARLISIGDGSVELQYRGETQMLRVGSSLP